MSQASQSPRPDTAVQRTDWVDVAKALCIILVVMMHSTLGLQQAVGAKGFLDPVVAFFAPFRIPTFFLLSGLFMERVLKRNFSIYLSSRILHFAYFYLLWLAIHLVIRSGPQFLAAPQDAAAAFLFALIEPYPALWFLHLLAVFSLVAFALRRMNPSIVLAAAAVLHLLRVETGSGLFDEFAGRAVFFAAGWVLAPAFFALAASALERPRLSAAAVPVFAAVNAAVVFLGSEQQALPGLALGIAGAVAMVVLSAWLAAVPRVGSRLAALGRSSLAIYLAFTLPMAAMRSILLAAGLSDGGTLILGFASLLVAGVAVAMPFGFARTVRGTKLDFLFARPSERVKAIDGWQHVAEQPEVWIGRYPIGGLEKQMKMH